MLKVIILKGLPASGKTGWAKTLLCSKQLNTWVRVNKDDIRSMFSVDWCRGLEKLVVQAEADVMSAALKVGVSVIVDDTNLNPVHERNIREHIAWLRTFYTRQIEVEVKEFDTPLEECIKRDYARANPVGEVVIRDMYSRWNNKNNVFLSKS